MSHIFAARSLQHLNRVARCEDRRHAGRERTAAPLSGVVVTERRGVGDRAFDALVRNAEFFRRDQRQRRARTADVDRADRERHRAVHADVQIRAGLAAEVEPEPARHAATLVLAERRFHVRMILRRLQRGADADRSVRRAVRCARAFFRSVLDAEVDRIHAEFCSATRSTVLSTANAAIGADGARYAATFGRFTSTS